MAGTAVSLSAMVAAGLALSAFASRTSQGHVDTKNGTVLESPTTAAPSMDPQAVADANAKVAEANAKVEEAGKAATAAAADAATTKAQLDTAIAEIARLNELVRAAPTPDALTAANVALEEANGKAAEARAAADAANAKVEVAAKEESDAKRKLDAANAEITRLNELVSAAPTPDALEEAKKSAAEARAAANADHDAAQEAAKAESIANKRLAEVEAENARLRAPVEAAPAPAPAPEAPVSEAAPAPAPAPEAPVSADETSAETLLPDFSARLAGAKAKFEEMQRHTQKLERTVNKSKQPALKGIKKKPSGSVTIGETDLKTHYDRLRPKQEVLENQKTARQARFEKRQSTAPVVPDTTDTELASIEEELNAAEKTVNEFKGLLASLVSEPSTDKEWIMDAEKELELQIDYLSQVEKNLANVPSVSVSTPPSAPTVGKLPRASQKQREMVQGLIPSRVGQRYGMRTRGGTGGRTKKTRNSTFRRSRKH